MKTKNQRLMGYLLLSAGLLLGSHKALAEKGARPLAGKPFSLDETSTMEKGTRSLAGEREHKIQTLRENQNFDPPSCDQLGEFIEDYLSRSQSYQGLLALSAREFKTKILEESSLSTEEKQALKTDLLKSLVLLEDTELVLMDQAEWIRQKLPGCLQSPDR